MYRDAGDAAYGPLKKKPPLVARILGAIFGGVLALCGLGGGLAMFAMMLDTRARVGFGELLVAFVPSVFCLGVGAYGIDLAARAIGVRSTDGGAFEQRYGVARAIVALVFGALLMLPLVLTLASGTIFRSGGGGAELTFAGLFGMLITALAIRGLMRRLRTKTG